MKQTPLLVGENLPVHRVANRHEIRLVRHCVDTSNASIVLPCVKVVLKYLQRDHVVVKEEQAKSVIEL